MHNIEVDVINGWRPFSHSEVNWIRWYRPDLLLLAITAWVVTAYSFARKVFNKERPDLVYLNSTPLSAWAVASKRFNIPVICHIREPIQEGYLGIRNYLLKSVLKKNVDQFIAVSHQNARTIDAPDKTSVIYDFIHFDYFNRSISPKDTSINNTKKTKTALYLGGAATIKGFEVVVEALEHLNPGITVLFGGYLSSRAWWKILLRKILKPHLAQLLQKLDSAQNALQIGIQSDVPELIAACDLLIAPFTVPHFARPIIEAGAMAKPVVGSNVDGMEELIVNGQTGILVPPGDPRALADAINTLCGDETLAKKMGHAGFERAKALFDGEKNALRTFEIFKDVLAGHHSGLTE